MGRGKNGKTNKQRRGTKDRNRTRSVQEKNRKAREKSCNQPHSHVFQSQTTASSQLLQAASFASTSEKMHMSPPERVAREDAKKKRQAELKSDFDSCGERNPNDPRADIDFAKPVLFRVRGGAEIPLPREKLDQCTVLYVDNLRIRRPSSPTRGLVCKTKYPDFPVFTLTPHTATLEALGVGDADFNSRIVSALEAVTRVQKTSTVRSCDVICQGRYCGGLGVTVTRGKKGTLPFSYHKKLLGNEVYDEVIG